MGPWAVLGMGQMVQQHLLIVIFLMFVLMLMC